jgi:hypothetical protein
VPRGDPDLLTAETVQKGRRFDPSAVNAPAIIDYDASGTVYLGSPPSCFAPLVVRVPGYETHRAEREEIFGDSNGECMTYGRRTTQAVPAESRRTLGLSEGSTSQLGIGIPTGKARVALLTCEGCYCLQHIRTEPIWEIPAESTH